MKEAELYKNSSQIKKMYRTTQVREKQEPVFLFLTLKNVTSEKSLPLVRDYTNYINVTIVETRSKLLHVSRKKT